MKLIKKDTELINHTLKAESVVIKFDPKAKKSLEYVFDALNYIYAEIKKQPEIQNINLFLLSIKPHIDSFIISKNKEPLYQLFNIAITQWLEDDIGIAYLRLDRPSRILKDNKISIPLPNCFEQPFISPINIYSEHSNSFFDPCIKLMKVNKVFIAELNFYYTAPDVRRSNHQKSVKGSLNSESSRTGKSRVKSNPRLNSYRDISFSGSSTTSQEDYINYLRRFKAIDERPTSNKDTKHKSEYIFKIGAKEETREKNCYKKYVPNQDDTKKNNDDKQPKGWGKYLKSKGWGKYLNSSKNSKSFDAEMAAEILEAFKEVDRKRSESNRKYLQDYYKNGGMGKFGLPQAKWRNGTYGISSKEPDFFTILDKQD
ncbi:hypothetical protein [Acinetobacter towneri]|uniref:hypothetical protein n=1 Tax=Acinetobacter towneri TaxID=202956 RepID=UPI003A8BED14